MYHYTINFSLFGLDSATIDSIKAAEPLKGFSHNFNIISSINDLIPSKHDIVIYTGLDPLAVRNAIGNKAYCIFCTKSPAALTSSELSAIDDIWTQPFSAELLSFYINKLLTQLKADKDSSLTETYLNTAINTIPDLIWYKDMRGAHLKVNDFFCSVVGKSKDDVTGRGHYYIWGLTKEQYEKGEFVCLDTDITVMEKKETCFFNEEVLSHSGKRLHLKTYKTPLFDDDGELIGTFGVARDVTYEYECNQQLLEMARTDELTGLANRWYFFNHLGSRRGKNKLTMLYIELTNFRYFNEKYGHKAGDGALISMSTVLRASFDSSAFIARIGNHEFVISLFQEYSTDELTNKLNSLLNRCDMTFYKKNGFDNLAIHVGIAHTDNPLVSIDDLMRQCSLALYAAKKQGEPRWCIYNSL